MFEYVTNTTKDTIRTLFQCYGNVKELLTLDAFWGLSIDPLACSRPFLWGRNWSRRSRDQPPTGVQHQKRRGSMKRTGERYRSIGLNWESQMSSTRSRWNGSRCWQRC